MLRSAIPLLLALLAAACTSPPREPETDPFFTLPIVAAAPTVEEEGGISGSGTHPAYTVEFRLTDSKGRLIQAPRLSMYAGQVANIAVLNQTSYIQDFDVEVAEHAFIADPVIAVYQEGLTLEVAIVPVEGTDRAALSYCLTSNELARPIRLRHTSIHSATERISIQFPQGTLSKYVGRTLVKHHEHTLLVEGPDGLRVSARVFPLMLPAPGAELVNFAVGGEQAEPESLIARAAELPPPAGDGALEISVVRLKGVRDFTTVHLRRPADLPALGIPEVEVLKRFLVRMEPEEGAKLSFQLEKSYLKDYEAMVTETVGVLDPIVGTVRAGFEGSVHVADGEPTLAWRLETLSGFSEFTTSVLPARDGPSPVSLVEVPEVAQYWGKLALRSPVNATPIARLVGGDVLAVMVRRL